MSHLVVFDVGGVLVKLTGMPDLMKLTGLSPDEIRDKWICLEVVRAFESGLISYGEFGSEVIAELRLPLTVSSFRGVLRSWMGELFPQAEAIVSATGRKNTVACLCNMNSVQWPGIRDQLGVGRWFDHAFLSHEMGKVKPDMSTYEHVSERMGVEPASIVFFDDTQANVDGAISCGWAAHRVQGTEELRPKLMELDLM